MRGEADRFRGLAAQVAVAYFSRAQVPVADVPHIIADISSSLRGLAAAPPQAHAVTSPPAPSRPSPVEIERSITPDGQVSVENGKVYKSLRRHLNHLGVTPDEYRSAWGLPQDYPMVAANYSQYRSALAHRLGLGRTHGRSRGRADRAAG